MFSDWLQRMRCAWARLRMGWDEPPDFYDKSGCPYWLIAEPDEGEPERWRIFGAGRRLVGEVGLLLDHDVLELADIRVFWERDRGRGLGTILLQRVIAFAKARGMSRIVGEARAEREEDQERLLAWYRQHGFAISERRNEAGEMMQQIELDLDSPSPA